MCVFVAAQLRELLALARVRPHVLQTWMDPLHQARDLRALCDQEGVHFTACVRAPALAVVVVVVVAAAAVAVVVAVVVVRPCCYSGNVGRFDQCLW